MSIVSELIAAAVPGSAALLYPALGETLAERSGITNLGTEGSMLAGALSSIVVTLHTGSAVAGVFAAVVAGTVTAAIHALAVVRRHANPLASGLVVWFLALGLTSVLGSSYNGKVVTPLRPLRIPGLSSLPGVGPLFNQNILVYVALLCVPLLVWFIRSTRPGLILRAAGERPSVLVAGGHHPDLVRILAVCFGGTLAGLGGAQLALGMVGNWSNGMTNGYGFVAVAVVTFARWNPWGVLGGSLLFGGALATAAVVQAHGVAVNQYLLDALPYLITVVVLVLVSRFGRTPPPEAQRHALSQAL